MLAVFSFVHTCPVYYSDFAWLFILAPFRFSPHIACRARFILNKVSCSTYSTRWDTCLHLRFTLETLDKILRWFFTSLLLSLRFRNHRANPTEIRNKKSPIEWTPNISTALLLLKSDPIGRSRAVCKNSYASDDDIIFVGLYLNVQIFLDIFSSRNVIA